MFCGKCGTKNDDNTKFCTNCGAKLNEKVFVPQKPVMTPRDGGDAKNSKVGMIAVAVIVVAVVLVGFLLFGGRSANATVKKFAKAVINADEKSMINLVHKKEVKYFLEEKEYRRDKLIDTMLGIKAKKIKENSKNIGKGISYKILGEQDIKESELKIIKDTYAKRGVKVSAAKAVKIGFRILDSEEEDALSLIKVGRSWYIAADPFGLSGVSDVFDDVSDALFGPDADSDDDY